MTTTETEYLEPPEGVDPVVWNRATAAQRHIHWQGVYAEQINELMSKASTARGKGTEEGHRDEQFLWLRDPADFSEVPEPVAQRGDFKIASNGTTVFYGLGGAGKSIFVLGLALSIASGATWLGGTVKPKRVLWLQLEGPYMQTAERIAAWEKVNGATVPPGQILHFEPEGFDWSAKTIGMQLGNLIHTVDAGLVVIDTLDAGRVKGSNMADEEIGRIFADVLPDIVRSGLRQVFLIAHSNAKDEAIAGLSRQRNAVENTIHIKARGDHRVAILTKSKDVPGRPEIPFEIVPSAYVGGMGPVGVVEVVGTEITGPAAWLVDELTKAGGSASSKAIKDAAQAEGLSDWQLRDARQRVAEVEKLASGSTVWTLRNDAA